MENINFVREPLNVLVVEDNPVDQKVLLSMLKEFPQSINSITLSKTLREAMDTLQEKKFNVALLDLNLPDSSGENTISTISSLVPEMAIVVSTGAYEDDVGLRTLRIGAQDFLVKSRYTSYALNKALHYSVERKRLELSLQKAYDELKETQASLIQAEKMRVVGGLASGVAHEVKNPLAIILYGVTYLKENLKSDDPKVAIVIKNISEATDRANNIISDLLDFSHLEKLNQTNVEIKTVIEKALTLVHHEFESRHIEVKPLKCDERCVLEIDVNRVEQVFVNIVLNAAYAMQGGGVLTVSIEKFRVGQDLSFYSKLKLNNFNVGDEIVCVNIADTGCGIPLEKMEHVFDPFFTTRRAQGGVGLGLAVAKNIMDLHKGLILFENKKESGTIAHLIFRS
jgi:signal transduction histidine kinase